MARHAAGNMNTQGRNLSVFDPYARQSCPAAAVKTEQAERLAGHAIELPQHWLAASEDIAKGRFLTVDLRMRARLGGGEAGANAPGGQTEQTE